MRSERIEGSQENIVQLSAIRRQKHRALSPYGPVKAGLTTLQRTDRDLQLTELLNSLESVVADLNSKSYTILASEFQVAPAPDGVYTLKMLYYSAPPYLTSSNVSNVFLNIAPDGLLYGALVEAEPYLMNDARINTWGSMYDRAISSLTKSDEEGQYSGVPLAMKLTAR